MKTPEKRDELIKLLLIEDDPDYTFLTKRALRRIKNDPCRFTVKSVKTLAGGLKALTRGKFDVVIADLTLPDSSGLKTFAAVHDQADGLPVIVLTSCDDDATALQSVQDGAQDYLLKQDLNRSLLLRSIRYAIERNRMRALIRAQALTDELTGLYNRRGFLTLADQQIRVAQREKKGFILVFADLDRLKFINDTFGHASGDAALTIVAKILRKTFRASDIIARTGGDEFVALHIHATFDDQSLLKARLRENFQAHNRKSAAPYKISLSIGSVYFDPGQPATIDGLMSLADRELYRSKRRKRRSAAYLTPLQGSSVRMTCRSQRRAMPLP